MFFVIGAGGHAKVVVSALQQRGVTVDCIYDDDARLQDTALAGIRIETPVSKMPDRAGVRAVIAIGDNQRRRHIAERFERIGWLSVIHPRAVVDPSAVIGDGSVVFAGAVVQADARIGVHAIVNTRASIDHDCNIGSFVHIAPGATLGGSVTVGAGTLLGIGSCVIPGIVVGEWSIVAAGSAVVCNIPSHTVARGVPARSVRALEPRLDQP